MTTRTFAPQHTAGKVALWISVIGFASWIVLPLITTVFRESAPITDTVLMPIIGVALMLVAAIVNFVTYVFLRQRSVLNLIFFSITVAFAAFVTIFLVGEGLAGV